MHKGKKEGGDMFQKEKFAMTSPVSSKPKQVFAEIKTLKRSDVSLKNVSKGDRTSPFSGNTLSSDAKKALMSRLHKTTGMGEDEIERLVKRAEQELDKSNTQGKTEQADTGQDTKKDTLEKENAFSSHIFDLISASKGQKILSSKSAGLNGMVQSLGARFSDGEASENIFERRLGRYEEIEKGFQQEYGKEHFKESFFQSLDMVFDTIKNDNAAPKHWRDYASTFYNKQPALKTMAMNSQASGWKAFINIVGSHDFLDKYGQDLFKNANYRREFSHHLDAFMPDPIGQKDKMKSYLQGAFSQYPDNVQVYLLNRVQKKETPNPKVAQGEESDEFTSRWFYAVEGEEARKERVEKQNAKATAKEEAEKIAIKTPIQDLTPLLSRAQQGKFLGELEPRRSQYMWEKIGMSTLQDPEFSEVLSHVSEKGMKTVLKHLNHDTARVEILKKFSPQDADRLCRALKDFPLTVTDILDFFNVLPKEMTDKISDAGKKDLASILARTLPGPRPPGLGKGEHEIDTYLKTLNPSFLSQPFFLDVLTHGTSEEVAAITRNTVVLDTVKAFTPQQMSLLLPKAGIYLLDALLEEKNQIGETNFLKATLLGMSKEGMGEFLGKIPKWRMETWPPYYGVVREHKIHDKCLSVLKNASDDEFDALLPKMGPHLEVLFVDSRGVLDDIILRAKGDQVDLIMNALGPSGLQQLAHSALEGVKWQKEGGTENAQRKQVKILEKVTPYISLFAKGRGYSCAPFLLSKLPADQQKDFFNACSPQDLIGLLRYGNGESFRAIFNLLSTEKISELSAAATAEEMIALFAKEHFRGPKATEEQKAALFANVSLETKQKIARRILYDTPDRFLSFSQGQISDLLKSLEPEERKETLLTIAFRFPQGRNDNRKKISQALEGASFKAFWKEEGEGILSMCTDEEKKRLEEGFPTLFQSATPSQGETNAGSGQAPGQNPQ